MMTVAAIMPPSILTDRSARRREQAVVVDVGSASVGAALVSFGSAARPLIHESVREPITFQQDLSIERFFKLLERAVGKAADRINAKASERGLATGAIHCVFNSPWYRSRTLLIHTRKDEPFTVTEETLAALTRDALARERGGGEDDGSLASSREALVGKGIRMEEHIIQVSLNGYPTRYPEGKRTRELALALYASALSGNVHDRTVKALASVFNDREVSFHSSMLAAYNVLRGAVASAESFLVVNVSGEVTDIGVVSESVLRETASFPHGRNFLMRHVVRELKTTPKEAASLIRRHLAGEGSASEGERARRALSSAAGVWEGALHRALHTLAASVALPSHTYLLSDPSFLPWFKERAAVQQESGRKLAVTPLTPELVAPYAATEAAGALDPFLLIDTLHVHSTHYEGALPAPEGA